MGNLVYQDWFDVYMTDVKIVSSYGRGGCGCLLISPYTCNFKTQKYLLRDWKADVETSEKRQTDRCMLDTSGLYEDMSTSPVYQPSFTI